MFKPQPAHTLNPTQLAALIGGELRDVSRPEPELRGLATLGEAAGNEVSFIASDKAAATAATSAAGLLVTSTKWEIAGRACVVVPSVWTAVATLMTYFYGEPAPAPGVHLTAIVGANFDLGPLASVGPYCVIGDDCALGEGSVLGPHCILSSRTRIGAGARFAPRVTIACEATIGDRVIIHSGAVIGADGFKFENVGGRPLKIPQVGTVVIEDDVEIGANTTIDRAFLYETRIGRGSKIDNLVQIAHNVQLGPGCILAAQAGIAGSSRLGAGVMMGGQTGVVDNITLGDGAIIGAKAAVFQSLAGGEIYHGTPAIPSKKFLRMMAALVRLPDLVHRVRALEAEGKKAGDKPRS